MSHSLNRIPCAVAALLLCLSSGPAPAKEKVKRERAQVVLPVLVETVTPGKSYTFQLREMFGAQPARFRSIVSLETPLPIPELATAIGVGEPLFEMRATTRNFTGPVFCKAHQVHEKQLRVLLCLADRDSDGKLDQLWQGVVATLEPLIPFPDMRSLRTIPPVGFRPVADAASHAFSIGFFVSGTNPLLGQTHFYPVLGRNQPSKPIFEHHKAVSLRELPKTISIGGAEIVVTSVSGRTYQVAVTRPFESGERLVTSPYPTRTIYISVPG